MFYIDGISLNVVREELKKDLINKKINRIFKNNDYSISLHFGKIELLFSCMPNLAICYITQNKEKPILDIASSIISNLRKHLMNAMLVDIEQLGFDRILVFHFTKINELGEVKKYYIYFECLAKASNLIFCDEEHKVIDSLKKFYISEKSDRTLFNGEKYQRPQFEKKISPSELTEIDFNRFKENQIALSSEVEGVGKIFENSLQSSENTFEEYKELLKSKKFKIYFEKAKLKLATVLDISYLNYDEIKVFESYNDLINFYISYESISTSFSLLKNKLISSIDKKIKKLNKTLYLIEEDIKISNSMNNIKEQADILASVLYSVKKGMSSILAYDFYNNKDIEIYLDTSLNPKENLDKIYKKYNKAKRSFENALRRKREVYEEINYLESNILFIEKAQKVEELREIEEELIKARYLNQHHQTKKTKIKKEIKYGILEYNGALILYGRNNIENDNLSLKIASKNDLWLHAKNFPSSHVIVKSDSISEEIIKKAAEVVAFYTKLSLGEKIEIDYTLKKYINKPNGAKLGFVTYSNQKTITVEKKELKEISQKK